MVRFHAVHEKLSQALDGLPDELCISDEVREQVCFFNQMLSLFIYMFVHLVVSFCLGPD